MPEYRNLIRSLISYCALGAVTLGLLLGTALPVRSADSLTDDEKRAFEEMIHDYIMAHPDVILESVKTYREQQEMAEQERASAMLASLSNSIGNDAATPIGGNPDGTITVVEFFDYNCGYCKRALDAVTELVGTDSNIRLVFKEFPILGESSVLASRASLAVWNAWPDRYQEFHMALMSSRGSVDNTRIMETAAALDLDANQLAQLMNAPEIDAALQTNYKLAETLGISGTPAFIIGKELVPGAIDLEAMRELVAKAAQG
jgi:protein-disulfide isomerase